MTRVDEALKQFYWRTATFLLHHSSRPGPPQGLFGSSLYPLQLFHVYTQAGFLFALAQYLQTVFEHSTNKESKKHFTFMI